MLGNFIYSSLSAGTAALLLVLMIAAGRVLGDVEFGNIAFADRGLLLVFGLAALFTGTGLRGLTIAFVLARGTALGLAAVLTQTRLGGIGFRYDREVWENLHREALPLGFFLVVLNLYSY